MSEDIYFLFGGAIFAAVLVWHWSIRRKLAMALAGRPPLTEAEFAALFPGAEETAAAVRQVLARYTPGDAARIRGSDRIARDLLIGAQDGLDANEIVHALDQRFAIRIPDERAAQVGTVHELVQLVQGLRA